LHAAVGTRYADSTHNSLASLFCVVSFSCYALLASNVVDPSSMTASNAHLRSSSPGEFHPEALTEPCLSLSAHTALAIQREQTLSSQRPSSSSCCQLTTRSWREWPVPFAPRALPRFVTTTRQSVPELRIRTLALVVRPLVASPLTSESQVPTFRSTASWQAQATSHAGCRSARKQVSSELVPQQQ
jgi:hypothetical protein